MAAALGFAADNSWSLEITYVRIFIAKYMGAQKLQLIHYTFLAYHLATEFHQMFLPGSSAWLVLCQQQGEAFATLMGPCASPSHSQQASAKCSASDRLSLLPKAFSEAWPSQPSPLSPFPLCSFLTLPPIPHLGQRILSLHDHTRPWTAHLVWRGPCIQ